MQGAVKYGIIYAMSKIMRVSILTVCYNAEQTIGSTMESVARQICSDDFEIEYLILDGGSTDGTVEKVAAFAAEVPRLNPKVRVYWQSEKDRGMYDALNKGIEKATGDVIGILNADDVFSDVDTIGAIAKEFETDGVDAIYADIRFVRELGGRTVRYCSARHFRPWMFRFGVMVPHPSFYCRRGYFVKLGGYSLDYRICADFELVMRYLWKNRLMAKYVPRCVVDMRLGGASTAGFRSNIEINREDLRALRANGYWSILPLLYVKYFFKVWGFIFRGAGANKKS